MKMGLLLRAVMELCLISLFHSSAMSATLSSGDYIPIWMQSPSADIIPSPTYKPIPPPVRLKAISPSEYTKTAFESFGITTDEITASSGKPMESRKSGDMSKLYYDGLYFEIDTSKRSGGGIIIRIVVKDNKWLDWSEIKIGDSYRKVYDVLGKPDIIGTERHIYENSIDMSELSIYYENDKVAWFEWLRRE